MLTKNLFQAPVWIYFLVIAFTWLVIHLDQSDDKQQQIMESRQLQAKKVEAESRKRRCGEDYFCKIYGTRVSINEKRALQFFAMVNGLQTRP